MAANFPPNGGGSGGGAVDSVNGKAGTVVIGKVDIGLGSVDNTSDADKPISTLAQAALDAKQDTLVSGTNIKTINGKSVLGSGNMDIGGSLQYLTEVSNTTTPNATVPVHGIQASGAETNIDLLLSAKGSGAIVAQIPNGGVGGGNKRGAGAVDLQIARSTAAQVASGSSSVAIGQSNTASGSSSVAIGQSNTASGDSSVAMGYGNTARNSSSVAMGYGNTVNNSSSVAMGQSNTASGDSSVAMGQSNTASGSSSVAMGQSNTASGSRSTIPGGMSATTNSLLGLLAYGFSGEVSGRNQMSFWGGRLSTTTGTPTRITADAGAASATNQLTLRNNSAFRVRGTVVARSTSTNDCKEWTFEALIKRGATAADTAIVGTPSITSTFADTAAAGRGIAVTADTTNGALAITATGVMSTSIRWTAVVHSIEVA